MYLQMKDVVKKYGEGENTIYALDHASLELEQGEICAVLGPSGSGKSYAGRARQRGRWHDKH